MSKPAPHWNPEGIATPAWSTLQRKRMLWAFTGAGFATVVIHICVYLFTPDTMYGFQSDGDWARFEERIAELQKEKKDEPIIIKFVEANPLAPQNIPDETTNQSNRDQQAAEETPIPLSESDTPRTDGESDHSQKIVDGEMDPEVGLNVPTGTPDAETEPTAETQAELAAPPPSVAPVAPEFIQQKPIDADGVGSTPYEPDSGDKPLEKQPKKRIIQLNRPESVEIVEQAISEQTAEAAQAKGMPVPQARPKLKLNLPSGPVRMNTISASRVGRVSIDARFSKFGEYSQRMSEAVSKQWTMLAGRIAFSTTDIGTEVRVVFELDDQGLVQNLEVTETTASRTATLIVRDAIMSRAPYGEWPDEMKASVGDSLEVSFRFHYY